MTKAQHIVTALLLATTACSNASDISGAYERGIAALEAGQPRTARVEFMNAIKADPDNGAARVMQARTYLALGDGIAAAAEIERARPLSIPASETNHLMAHALVLQDEHDRALAERATFSPAHASYAARRRAHAFPSACAEAAAAGKAK